jgi:prepilin-type N-terminal cleavage/methylation domain-containing protein
MKKGFTLIEMIIVLAIIGVLISVAYMNINKTNSKATADSISNEISSMIREVYENSNKEMDYSLWNLEINNYAITEPGQSENMLFVKLRKGNTVIKEISSKTVSLKETTTSNFSSKYYYISFDSSGKIILKSKDELGNETTSNVESLSFDVIYLNDTSSKKTVEIKSMPPGSISVK